MRLSRIQKEMLCEWFKRQETLPVEFKALDLPSDLYLKIKAEHYIDNFDEEVNHFVRKQVLAAFK